MKQFSIFSVYNKQVTVNAGFTLLELIIVFSVLAITATIGIASFKSYSDYQKLRSAGLDFKTMLQEARSEAVSQVKPTGCGTLQGYEVRICGGNPPCLSTDATIAYEMDALCSSVPSGIFVPSTGIKLPAGVTIQSNTITSFIFVPITGGVVQTGSMVLTNTTGATMTTTITSTGLVQ